MQEGFIIVWQSLGRGVAPSAEVIEGRMTNWVRLLGTQIGHGRAKSYAELLPLDDFEHLTYDPIPTEGHDGLA